MAQAKVMEMSKPLVVGCKGIVRGVPEGAGAPGRDLSYLRGTVVGCPEWVEVRNRV